MKTLERFILSFLSAGAIHMLTQHNQEEDQEAAMRVASNFLDEVELAAQNAEIGSVHL